MGKDRMAERKGYKATEENNEDPACKGGRIGAHAGREKGGKVSANETTSAAAVAKTFSGISFPASENDVIKRAHQNSDKVEDADAVIDILNQIPDREYVSVGGYRTRSR